jgi:hypothetical protein
MEKGDKGRTFLIPSSVPGPEASLEGQALQATRESLGFMMKQLLAP